MSDHPNISNAVNDAQESKYELHPDVVQFVTEALLENDPGRARNLVKDLHCGDMAELISVVKPEHREALVQAIRDDFDPEILVDLEPSLKEEVLGYLGTEESAAAITQLESDDAVQVIEDLEQEEQAEILEAIPEERREVLEEGLAHPEDSAGRLMDKRFVAIAEDWTVGQTIDLLRSDAELPDDFYSIFVVDKDHRPIGSVLLSRVIRREREVQVKDIMFGDVKVINLEMDQEEIAYLFQKYALSSAPVVNADGVMIAQITLDDVLDVVEEEAEEDIMRLGGVSATDVHTPPVKTAMHRFPWLLVNLLTAIAASVIIALFEDAIQKLVALAVLMPIVASMAGNAGTQTLTIAVRALATRDLTAANALWVVRKEIHAAILNGLFFALIVGGISLLVYHNLYLSVIFAAATLISLTVAAFAGAMIPLALAKAGVDPAVASSVFLTTVTDMSAFFVFLGLASWWLA